MGKQSWKPGNMLNPVPAVMVSCADREGKPNIITIAWAGTVCTNPPMVSISVRPTRYSYEDICFLNEQFSKYGKYHLQEMLQIVYQLHIDQLLPHILISINDCFNQAKPNLNQFAAIIKDNRQIVQLIIYKAFVKYSEEIKREHQLTLAYESILETLAELDYEDAAVILDEFRLH